MSIAPGQYRFMKLDPENKVRKYINHGYFTISGCWCDIEFQTCLNRIGTPGRILYNFYREVMSGRCLVIHNEFQLLIGEMPPPLSYTEEVSRFHHVVSEELQNSK